jgi:hypothetical protein
VTLSSTPVARARPRDPAPAPARWLRGVLVGLVSGIGAVAAHQLVGGHASATIAVVVTAVSVAAGVALARWRVGVVAALGLAVVAQATSHLLMVGSAGHHDHMHAHMGPTPHDAGSGAVSMLLAHLAVALVTAAVSRGADQAVLDLVRTLVGWFLARSWLPILLVPRTRAAHVTDSRLLPSLRDLTSPLTRRGPPALTRLSLTPP